MQKKNNYKKGRSMDLAYVFLKYFFETEYMHFGYWEAEDEIKFLNFKKAQARYVDILCKMIPQDVHSILEVGCGSGQMANDLLAKGYQLDAVSPPCIMTSIAAKKIAGKGNIYETKFESFEMDKSYDLVLFSESFQFVKLVEAVSRALKYSKKYILIADVFKKTDERGPIGGGHQYSEFLELIKKNNLVEVENLDVTSHIAPQFDLEVDLMQNFAKPLCAVGTRVYTTSSSVWMRALAKLFMLFNRKRLKKLQAKYFEDKTRNGAAFEKYKTYRFILLRKVIA